MVYMTNPLLRSNLGLRDRPKSLDDQIEIVERILLEEINLAKPEDLASLEFHSHYIARRICVRLGLQHDQKE